jgi:hypothetical protein
MKPTITGVTISCDFGDKSYGNGQGSFANCTARYPEEGLPLEQLDQVVQDSLEMVLMCWKTLMLGRFSVGIISATEFKETFEAVTKRIDKAREYLAATGRTDKGGA